MTATISQPHNNFFGAMLSEKAIMIDFLKAHLPDRIQMRLDFSTLRFEKDIYINLCMKELRSDLLVSVGLKQSQAYMYLLIEHQSQPERWMALKLQEYIVAIQRYSSQSSDPDHLPFIYPMVFFTGQRPWRYRIHLREWMFTDIQDLFAKQLQDTVQLIDLNRLGDEILNRHGLATVVEQALKHGPQCDIMSTLRRLHVGLDRYGPYRDAIGIVLRYLYTVCTDGRAQLKAAIEWCDRNLNNLRGIGAMMMTIAERLRQEGRQEGVVIGEQKLIKVIQAMLKRGYSAQAIEEITGISVAEIQKLEQEALLD